MVTGHRKLAGSYNETNTHQWVRGTLNQLLTRLQVRYGDGLIAVSGMALGVDMMFAEEAIKLGISVTAAVPFATQDGRWPPRSQEQYRRILAGCDKVVLVEGIPAYKAGSIPAKLQLCNVWMVDHSTMTIAVWDGGVGGTANCVKACKRIGRKVVRIDPVKREVTMEQAT